MEGLTIIYYSANTEAPEFEKKITDSLVENSGGLPIVSVSRKPMDLGQNFCIGEQPVCYSNEWKQILLGLKAAFTRFCIAAESDCLYPPEYFTFTPKEDDRVYRYKNIWAYWKRRRNWFWRKPRCEGAQVCGREYWIKRLEYMIGGHQGWQPMEENPGVLVSKIFPKEGGTWTGDPILTFKTGNSLGNKTSLCKMPPVMELPYWGSATNIYKRMFQ